MGYGYRRCSGEDTRHLEAVADRSVHRRECHYRDLLARSHEVPPSSSRASGSRFGVREGGWVATIIAFAFTSNALLPRAALVPAVLERDEDRSAGSAGAGAGAGARAGPRGERQPAALNSWKRLLLRLDGDRHASPIGTSATTSHS